MMASTSRYDAPEYVNRAPGLMALVCTGLYVAPAGDTPRSWWPIVGRALLSGNGWAPVLLKLLT